jgi:hypothetical protein
MAMHPCLAAIVRKLRGAGFIMLACFLGWHVSAFAAEPLVIQGSDTFTFEVVPNPYCPGVQTSDTGRGQSSHLGQYTFTAGECIINLATPRPEVTLGFFTLTTADRSTVTGNYSGSAEYADASMTSVIYAVSGFITGGTGRFRNATTGTFAFLGGADLSTGTGFDTIAGNIYTAAASSAARDR